MIMSADNAHPTEMLPLYVNGTLDESQLQHVELHISDCDQCQRELQFLQALQQHIMQVDAVEVSGEYGVRRLVRDIRQYEAINSRNSIKKWKLFAVAAMLIVIIQTGVIVNLNQQHEAALYVPSGASITTNAGAVVIEIMFSGEASASDIQQLLQSVGADIVSGPGAIGVYRISLDIAEGDKEQLQIAIDRLKSNKDIVVYVSE